MTSCCSFNQAEAGSCPRTRTSPSGKAPAQSTNWDSQHGASTPTNLRAPRPQRTAFGAERELACSPTSLRKRGTGSYRTRSRLSGTTAVEVHQPAPPRVKAGCTLLELPPELMLHILCNLHHREIGPVLLTCKELSQLAYAALDLHFKFLTPLRDQTGPYLPRLRPRHHYSISNLKGPTRHHRATGLQTPHHVWPMHLMPLTPVLPVPHHPCGPSSSRALSFMDAPTAKVKG